MGQTMTITTIPREQDRTCRVLLLPQPQLLSLRGQPAEPNKILLMQPRAPTEDKTRQSRAHNRLYVPSSPLSGSSSLRNRNLLCFPLTILSTTIITGIVSLAPPRRARTEGKAEGRPAEDPPSFGSMHKCVVWLIYCQLCAYSLHKRRHGTPSPYSQPRQGRRGTTEIRGSPQHPVPSQNSGAWQIPNLPLDAQLHQTALQ